MKKKDLRLSMRINLTLLMVAALGVIVVLAWLGALLLRYFRISLPVPDIVWLLVISMALGATVTTFVGKWLLDPVTELGEAMGQVAKGNFDVRLKEKHRFREIEEIYRNFNLMAQELGATEILQTDFVSNVSHEFKTPINAIEGYATLLQGEEDVTAQERRAYVDKILRNTRRLSRLVGNILLLSKVDNQAILSQETTFRLDEQIRQSIVQLEPEWEKKDIEFDVRMQNITYTGMENLLIHVWNNLIGNAVKFSPQGGYIGITLSQGESVEFTVEDRGPGIPEADRSRIFNRFYQTDSSHKEEGNGLGLALVKQILDVSQGTVAVENNPEGGCRFTVRLPVRQGRV